MAFKELRLQNSDVFSEAPERIDAAHSPKEKERLPFASIFRCYTPPKKK